MAHNVDHSSNRSAINGGFILIGINNTIKFAVLNSCTMR